MYFGTQPDRVQEFKRTLGGEADGAVPARQCDQAKSLELCTGRVLTKGRRSHAIVLYLSVVER